MTKILLVEDDNNLREIYQARLMAEGYEILTARDGEEALVVAKANKPDLVISDVMMPKISGFEMLNILRNTPELQATKVIMLTALGQNDDQKRADMLGADRYLVKSQVTLEDIVNATHALLDSDSAAASPDPLAASTEPAAPPAAAPVSAAIDRQAAAVDNTAASLEVAQDAQPQASEEAALKERIEDFVSGASSEPGKASAAPPAPALATTGAATEPAAVAEPTVTFNTIPQPQAGPNTAADDKLMDQAVSTLVANTQAEPPATPAAAGEPAAPPAPAAVTPAPEADTRKKIIQPIDSSPKPDLNKLLAEEQAREAAAAIPQAAAPPAATPPAAPAQPAAASTVPPPSAPPAAKPTDPNSIAI